MSTTLVLSTGLTLPLLCLHAWNVHRHPKLAIPGTLATMFRLSHPLHPVADCLENMCWAQFLFALHMYVNEDEAEPFVVLKTVIQFAAVTSLSADTADFHNYLLISYAVYVALKCTTRIMYHLTYFFIMVPIVLVESLRPLMNVCVFMWMQSAYELADIVVFLDHITQDPSWV